MNVGELFMYLGFKADTVKLNEFVHAVGELNLGSVLASLGVKELYDGLKHIMDVADKSAVQMNLFGAETGLSAQKMQQWTYYAERMGVSGESVTNALTGLQKKMTGLKLGTDSSLLTPLYLLNQAGANITNLDLENPFTFLEKALHGLQKVNPELRTTIANMLGINEQLLAIKSFAGADGILVPSQAQTQEVLAFHKAWAAVGQTMNQVFTDLAATYAPDLTNLGNALTTGFEKLHEWRESLRPIAEIVSGIASLFVPWLRIPYIIYMITTHLRELGDTFNDFKSSLTTGWKGFADFMNPSLSLQSIAPAGGGSDVTQHNTFHIVAQSPEEVMKNIRDGVGALLDDAKRQQPLSSR